MDKLDLSTKMLKKAGYDNLVADLTTKLSQSQISTLLLALSKEITNKSTPHDLVKKYASNRFVKPSQLNPIKVKRIEIDMLEMAGDYGFSPVLLSPASLLGCCSVIAKVDQNNVISATRGIELISDSTNMLAIHLAHGIKNKVIDNARTPIHLSATCRVTRGQMFEGDVFMPHFSMLTLVSSGKDRGSYGFEKDALEKHIEYYIGFFEKKLGQKLSAFLNLRKGYTDEIGFIDRISSHLIKSFPSLSITINQEGADNRYYIGLNFKIKVNDVDLIDGGFVDWTQKLLGNKKERLLISGAGVDLLLITGMIN